MMETSGSGQRVLVVGPSAPPYGGVALQSAKLAALLKRDGLAVTFLPSNPALPRRARFCQRVPGLRTAVRFAVFCHGLRTAVANADILHVSACSWLYWFLAVLPAVVAGYIGRKRVIIKYHGGEADRFLRWYGPVVRPVFRMAQAVTAPSPFLAEVIRRRIGVSVTIVPNILDLAAFSFRQRETFRPRMLVTRQLERLYDIDSVLSAFRELQHSYPSASLWIAGTGREEGRLRRLAVRLKLENVTFLGHVRHEDLPGLYDQCDFLLNASRADNFPASLLEGAAAGLVVVSTGVGGISHMFDNGTSALLVPAGDSAALAAAVLRVLEEPGLGRRLTSAALQAVRQCEWTNVRRHLYSVYGLPADRNAAVVPGSGLVAAANVYARGWATPVESPKSRTP